MKILMLVNWKIEYSHEIPHDKQPPDYFIEGQPYWFFRYFKNTKNLQVDVVDVHSFLGLEKFEKKILRFYVWQTLKCIPHLHKYDLILSHGMQSGIVLSLIRRIMGKGSYKHIVFDIGAFNSGKESGKALKLMQFASKSLDGVIYHTEIQGEYYKRCYPWLVAKSRFITFGTDSEYFIKKREIKENIEAPYILCIGYNKRDWDTVIKAYSEITTDIHLRFIGNKKIKTENPQIDVWDEVNITELKSQIEKAYFCVVPLKLFNYSYGQMTLLQQMAMGKAVIVADVPSVKPYLTEGAMLWYEPENEKRLQEKMQQLIDNPELIEKLGKRAEYIVKTVFNEKHMAGEIEQMIHDVMGGKENAT